MYIYIYTAQLCIYTFYIIHKIVDLAWCTFKHDQVLCFEHCVFCWKKLLIRRVLRRLVRCFLFGFPATLFWFKRCGDGKQMPHVLFWWSIWHTALFNGNWLVIMKDELQRTPSFSKLLCRKRMTGMRSFNLEELGKVDRFFFDHPLARSRVLQWKKVMKTRWKAVFRFYDSMLVIEVFFFWGGTKSSHSDLPKGTNKYLLKELLGVAGVEKFWSNWTFAWLQWRSLQGIQILLWLSWWFHPTFGVFFSGGALPCSGDEEAFDLMGTWGWVEIGWFTLPETNTKSSNAPENGWKAGWPIFRGFCC